MGKLERLQELLAKLKAGDFKKAHDKYAVIADVDGTEVPLTDPRAIEVLERRIAEEGGYASQ